MSNFLLHVRFPFLCLPSEMLEAGREPAAQPTRAPMLHPGVNRCPLPHSGSQPKTQKQQEVAKGCVTVLHVSSEGKGAFPERPT